ncbi:metallopeptidase [Candidatus Bathyarchaeota archaeon]|nr:metallopeptidase [Candidatus Bathyarchaeota archaeon]MCJ7713519.1 metallopeptidase [Candidatus Bathyarchaeota archaeon]
MVIKYFDAPDIKEQVDSIISDLELSHILPQLVYCVRSKDSKAKRTIARIHGLSRIWQGVLNTHPTYIIEVINETFGKMKEEEKEKTLIHELLHIPGGFSGGFRPHKGYVERKTVEKLYKRIKKIRAERKK